MRSCIPRAIALAFSMLAACAFAAPPDDLTGCWRTGKITQTFANGTTSVSDAGQCTLRYKDGQMVSSCAFSMRPITTTYSYRVLKPGLYSSTMLTSSASTQLLGTTREHEYKIEGSTLTLTTRPKITAAATETTPVRIDSQSARMDCQ